MAKEDDFDLDFSPQVEQPRPPDPLADQRNYFAYWEARRIVDQKRRQQEESSLNIYERARGENWSRRR